MSILVAIGGLVMLLLAFVATADWTGVAGGASLGTRQKRCVLLGLS